MTSKQGAPVPLPTIYGHLWRKRSASSRPTTAGTESKGEAPAGGLSLRIPHTLVLARDADDTLVPKFWIFTSKQNGEVLKKRETDASAFHGACMSGRSSSSSSGSLDIVAQLISVNAGQTEFDFLDETSLLRFLARLKAADAGDAQLGMTGLARGVDPANFAVLQSFVAPAGGNNAVLRVLWSASGGLTVQQCVNSRSLSGPGTRYERAATYSYQGAAVDTVSFRSVQAPLLCSRLLAQCDAITRHVAANSADGAGAAVARMCLYFKQGSKDRCAPRYAFVCAYHLLNGCVSE